MATTTFTTSHPSLFLNPTNHHRLHHHTTTATVSFPIQFPLPPLYLIKTHTLSKKPYLLKPKSTLLPFPQFPSLTPSLPTKETLITLLDVLKRVAVQLLSSLSSLTLSLPTKETLITLLIASKTVAVQLLSSIHEFKEPLIAVANAVGKWVDLYHSVLIVRILLSWFPNMPWEKQPFSAIRDLCDPCLNFFRTIMPPSANSRKLDLSPLLAFAVLGVLGSFLKRNIPPV